MSLFLRHAGLNVVGEKTFCESVKENRPGEKCGLFWSEQISRGKEGGRGDFFPRPIAEPGEGRPEKGKPHFPMPKCPKI